LAIEIVREIVLTDKSDSVDEGKMTCAWCGAPVEERTWKDGKKVYCSSSHHSAGIFPVMFVVTLTMTALILVTMLFPQIILEAILGPLAESLIIVVGLYLAMIIFYGIFLYICYDGWRVRSGRYPKPDSSDIAIEGSSADD